MHFWVGDVHSQSNSKSSGTSGASRDTAVVGFLHSRMPTRWSTEQNRLTVNSNDNAELVFSCRPFPVFIAAADFFAAASFC